VLLLLLLLLLQTGTWYDIMKEQAQSSYPTSGFGPGYATFTYATKQRATQLWYHDHTCVEAASARAHNSMVLLHPVPALCA
jgi:hypothetical protein